MTFQDAFAALHSGDLALMSLAEARLSVAFELGIPPMRFRPDKIAPDDSDALWAVEVVRSYQAVRHLLEAGPTLPTTSEENIAEARLLMKPKPPPAEKAKKAKKQDATVAAQNSLWRKSSY